MLKKASLSLHVLPNSTQHLDLFLESEFDLITLEIDSYSLQDFFLGVPLVFKKKKAHRKIYLDYEGEISNHRGSVQNLWKGFWKACEVINEGQVQLITSKSDLEVVEIII